MNWFWFALIALICWSGSDLFSKIGCCGEKDKTAHLKMVVAVGIVMGLHAAYMIVFHHVSVTWDVVWTYLPVSLLYILSMTLGVRRPALHRAFHLVSDLQQLRCARRRAVPVHRCAVRL